MQDQRKVAHLDDLREGLWGGLSQQGQQEAAVQLPHTGSQSDGEGSKGLPGGTRVLGRRQELPGAFQQGREHLQGPCPNLPVQTRDRHHYNELDWVIP